jgi:DNA-binding transcriptional ArsR family regulator
MYLFKMNAVFKALADASRRELLDRLRLDNGQTLNELCARLDMTRQAVSKHLAILEGANLVATVWRGREKLHYLNPVPITRSVNAGSENSRVGGCKPSAT